MTPCTVLLHAHMQYGLGCALAASMDLLEAEFNGAIAVAAMHLDAVSCMVTVTVTADLT